MTKKEIINDILEILEKGRIGITVSRLAQLLDVSRPTIYKYLHILRKENKVEEIDLGGSKCWTMKSSSSQGKYSIISSYQYILDILLETIEKELMPNIDWKYVGELMSERIQEEQLLETHELFDLLRKEGIEPYQLKEILDKLDENLDEEEIFHILVKLKPFFKALFRLIFAFLDDCIIESPIEVRDPPTLIFRVNNIKIIKDTRIMDIFVGLIRKKLQQFFWNRITIYMDYVTNLVDNYFDLYVSLSNVKR